MLRKNSFPKKSIDAHDEKSTPSLLVGFSNSMFQASGDMCGPSNWTDAAENKTVPPAGSSIQHWSKFESDLDLMVKAGANSYRFSIEWSQIESTPGEYNELIIAQYAKMFLACRVRRLEPMVTLFHFTEPLWFSKLGGFANETNIPYFTNFCKKMFEQFHSMVSLWSTINEPAIYAFSGYLYGQFPPHRHNLQQTVDVLTHLLKAHVTVYQSLKKMPGGETAQIGIVHNLLKFLPRYWWEPIELIVTKKLTEITNNLVLDFLKKGEINYRFGCRIAKHYQDHSAINSFDFIGLNFYANPVIGFNSSNIFGPTSFPGQVLSDMQLPIDPVGFALAIDEFALLKKPIYITETGIADAQDRIREKFLTEYLAVFEKKRSEGIDLRGCYHWTFADNYEWNEAYTKQFGLFDQDRIKRKSAKVYENFMHKYKVHEEIEEKNTFIKR